MGSLVDLFPALREMKRDSQDHLGGLWFLTWTAYHIIQARNPISICYVSDSKAYVFVLWNWWTCKLSIQKDYSFYAGAGSHLAILRSKGQI